MKALSVKDARKVFAATDVSGFAAEMGISISDANAVKAYINRTEVSGDGLVILEETIIDGEKIGAGNIRL